MDEKRLKEIEALPARRDMADSDDRSENYLVGREMAAAIRELLEERRQTLLQVHDLENRIYQLGIRCDRVPGLQRGFCPEVSGQERDNLTRLSLALDFYEAANRQVSEAMRACTWATHDRDHTEPRHCVASLASLIELRDIERRGAEKPKDELSRNPKELPKGDYIMHQISCPTLTGSARCLCQPIKVTEKRKCAHPRGAGDDHGAKVLNVCADCGGRLS